MLVLLMNLCMKVTRLLVTNVNNKGALWLQDKQSETHPDLKGVVTVGGVDYYISAWENVSENPNAPKFNLSLMEKK